MMTPLDRPLKILLMFLGIILIAKCHRTKHTFFPYMPKDNVIHKIGYRGPDSLTIRKFVTNGGELFYKEEYPWLVSIKILQNKSFQFGTYCSGSLIRRNVVLTAAHCFFKEDKKRITTKDNVQIHVDTLMEGGRQIRVRRFVLHPRFKMKTSKDDIALLILRERADLMNHPPISLPTGLRKVDFDNTFNRFVIVGFAETKAGEANIPLRVVDIVLHSQSFCKKKIKRYSEKYLFCARPRYGTRLTQPCEGDSGGALMLYSFRLKEWVLIGILSGGKDVYCSARKGTSYIVKVSSYLPWIENHLKEM